MPPTGSDTGNRNLDIEGQLWLWNRQTKLGKGFNCPALCAVGYVLHRGQEKTAPVRVRPESLSA